MSRSVSTQKLKLFRFCYLLLVLLVLQLLILDQPSFAIEITGECKKRCDESRPIGEKLFFKFNCKDVYKSEEDRKKCRESCESCPKEVCDETIEPEKENSENQPSANKWHCPSTELEDTCRSYCNKHRPKGTREKYTLNCDTTYSADWDRNNCKAQCSNCPSFVCRKNETHLFHCPDEKFDGECKRQCDKARKYGEIGTFSFDCDGRYSWDSEQADCKVACGKCPSWVCDARFNYNNYSYSCPTIQLEGECLEFCENRGGDSTIDCDHWGDKEGCKEGCKKCPFPGSENPVCDSNLISDFLCPKLDPKDEPLTSQKSYKGACKNRCEANQGGGFHEYTLKCHDRYSSNEEKRDCEQDCDQCGQKNCQYGYIIKCRGIKSEIEREKKEKEEEEEQQRKKLKEKDDLYLKATEETRQTGRSFVIGILVGLVVLLSVFGGILCCIYRNNNNPMVQVQPQFVQRPAVQPFQQQQWSQGQVQAGGNSVGSMGNQQQVPIQQQVPVQQQASYQPAK